MRTIVGLSAAFVITVSAVAQTSPVTFKISNVTRAAPPNGRYHDAANEFNHGSDKFTYDVLFSIDPNDDWTVGGLIVEISNNAQIYYNSVGDPNLPTAPGSSSPQKYSSFVNNPRSQYTDGRFVTQAALIGSYLPPDPAFVMSTEVLNVAWIELPPQSSSLDTSAATMRLTIDTLGQCYEGQRVYVTQRGPRHSTDQELASVEFAVGTQRNGGVLSMFDFHIYTAACGPQPRASDAEDKSEPVDIWLPATGTRYDPELVDLIDELLQRNYWLR